MIAKTQNTATTQAATAFPMLMKGDTTCISTRQNGLNSKVCACFNELANINCRWFRNIGAITRTSDILGEHFLWHRRRGERRRMMTAVNIEKMALKKQWNGSKKDIQN